MPPSTNSVSNIGSFVPTTSVWEIQQIISSNIDPQLKEILIRLYQNINAIALVLNTKDTGYYVQQEFLNGQLFFPDPNINSTTAQAPSSPTYRQVFRTVVNFGPLPNATTAYAPHNIVVDAAISFTRIYGVATDPSSPLQAIPLPYANITSIDNVSVFVAGADVGIITGVDYSSYTQTYVILEYIKG